MYDEDHHNTIAQLITLFGTKEKCLSLGFLVKDDNATMYLSPAGLGYLLDVVARDVSALPDAYAAGYIQGQTQAKEEL